MTVDLKGFDFFDFGCSTGANIELIARAAPGLRGLGFDIDPAKVAAARAKGLDAEVFDITALPKQKLVSFVTMSHFLEHLSSPAQAMVMIRKGVEVSRDFVAIRQPWFDCDGNLFHHRLKFYWSDWRGHPNRMVSLDFFVGLRKLLDEKLITGYQLAGRGPVSNSGHESILPLQTGIDQHKYDPNIHGTKSSVEFDFTAYKEIVVIVWVRDRRPEHPVLTQIRPFEIYLDVDRTAEYSS